MSDLTTLLSQYGWHIAIVGLIGTILIEILKIPMNSIISKKFPDSYSNTQKMDSIWFILGLAVAAILGLVYSVIASHTDILSRFATSGQGITTTVTAWTYFTNIFGTLLFQTIYYSIYRKLGVKKILQILLKTILSLFDKDDDGQVEILESIQTIQNLFSDGKITKEEISQILSEVAKETISDVTEQAGEEATVDKSEQISNITDLANNVVQTIPNDYAKLVATMLLKLAKSKAESVLTED